MASKAYDMTYLEDVMDNLGKMLEYSISYGFNPISMWEMFVSSKVASEIEKGNPKFISGYSARDYIGLIINITTREKTDLYGAALLEKVEYKANDEYYWAGSVIARFQYESGLSFYNINKYMPLEVVLDLYGVLHEADIEKFLDIARARVKKEKIDTNLKIIRKASGLSQRELAEKSQVELRSIQMYEQRRNDINKAQVDTLYKLAKTLGCNMEDLLE